MKTFLNQKASVERLPLFDNLRGLIIFLTLIMTLLTKFEFTPKWIPHANELNELHLADIGVVMFCFILSVMYSYGYIKKSKTLGKAAAKRQLIIRGLALVGIGFTVNMSGLFLDSQTMFGQMITSWEIIVTFGFINVFGVVFLDVVPEIRFFIGFALVIIHQILLNTGENYTRAILSNDQGGVFGLIPYLGLLLMACSVGEFYFRNKRKFYAFSASVIALGITLFVAEAVAESETAQKMLFVSKFQITLSFVMISFAISLAALVILDRIKFVKEREIPFIAWLGQSCLFYYLLGGIVYTVITKSVIGKPIVLGYIEGGTVFDLCIGIAIYMAVLAGVSFVLKKFNIKIRI